MSALKVSLLSLSLASESQAFQSEDFILICFYLKYSNSLSNKNWKYSSNTESMESLSSNKSRETVMEKILRQAELTEGVIRTEDISKLLKSLYPDVPIDKKQLEEIKKQHDIHDERCLDFESVMKVLLSFLLQQSVKMDSFSDFNSSEDSEDTSLTLDELIPFSNL